MAASTSTLLETIAFTVGGEPYRWEDLILAAVLWGDWPDLEHRTREGIACLRQADQAGERLPAERVDEAAKAFRYDRDLISGEDTRAWLSRRGLTPEAWMDYIRRSVLREEAAADPDNLAELYPATDEKLEPAILAEVFCSGLAGKIAENLAARAAVFAARASRSEPPPLSDGPFEVPTSAPLGIPPERAFQRFQLLSRLEESFEHFRSNAVTPRAVRDQISTHQLDWIRFSCQELLFSDEQSAREGLFCIRDDGTEAGVVASDAHVPLAEVEFFLEDMNAGYRDRLAAARVGDCVGPFPMDGKHALLRILDKRIPSESDSEIQGRAGQKILASASALEVERHVTWHTRP